MESVLAKLSAQTSEMAKSSLKARAELEKEHQAQLAKNRAMQESQIPFGTHRQRHTEKWYQRNFGKGKGKGKGKGRPGSREKPPLKRRK